MAQAPQQTLQPDRLTPQADRLVFASTLRAECHVAGARFFGNVHLGLGAVAAALAAGAGATAFASNNVLAGTLGIVAAAVTALLTSLRPDERSQLHWNAANGFADLANRTYMTLIYGGREVDGEEAELTSAEGVLGGAEDPPKPEQGTHEESEPEPDMPEGQLSDTRRALDALQREFQRLDAAAPPLPGRLTAKGLKAVREHRTWHPPQYSEFERWRDRIAPLDRAP